LTQYHTTHQRLTFHAPLAWTELLDFFRARAIPGVECVSASRYSRSVRLGRNRAVVEIRLAEGAALNVAVHSNISTDNSSTNNSPTTDSVRSPGENLTQPLAGTASDLAVSVQRLCDLAMRPEQVRTALESDPVLAPSISARPGLRLPGAWEGFEVGVRAILGQQVTVKGASTLSGRLVERFGQSLPDALVQYVHAAQLRTTLQDTESQDTKSAIPVAPLSHVFPSAKKLVSVDVAAIGLPATRAACIREFARQVYAGHIRFDREMSAEVLQKRLLAIRGIGPWTAHYIVMRGLNYVDAFPSGDLILRRAMNPNAPEISTKCLEAHSQRWRPWRAYAAMHLWRLYGQSVGGRAAGG
jgi:AraC family transcriptional regulator of adaptative response / DNA-3-methyladenine glycosylase II